MITRHLNIIIFTLFLHLLLPSLCLAYIDPSTGGYIFQLLFPILSALAAVFLFFRNGVKRMIDILLRRTPPEDRG